jgi:hypothetical protein
VHPSHEEPWILSKHSRHIERRVLSARNKIEDGETWPEYIHTSEMIADIGTKALPDRQFAYLRDLMNGYSMVKLNRISYSVPSYVCERK